jgi:chaperonin GroES
MKIRPLGDRLLIKIQVESEKTSGGIIIPKQQQQKTDTAIVLRIGKQIIGECDLKEGDIIVYDKYAGQPLIVDDEEFVVIKMDDILAVMEK